MTDNIVPLCLYKRTDRLGSYIGSPTKIRKNGETILACQEKPDTQLILKFYAIDPEFPVVPPGMVLLCAKDTPTDDFTTIALTQVYDVFDYEENCVRFFAWLEPIPHTTPLHIWQNGDLIYVSLQNEIPALNYTQVYFSPIYVLIDPRIENVVRIPGFSSDKFSVQDDKPQFRFSDYQGRCIPDPNGLPIKECLANILSTKTQKNLTLLDYLENRYNKKRNWNIFSLIGLKIIFVILFIFFLSFFFLLREKRTKMKTIRKN
jgi:hypothetical protein